MLSKIQCLLGYFKQCNLDKKGQVERTSMPDDKKDNIWSRTFSAIHSHIQKTQQMSTSRKGIWSLNLWSNISNSEEFTSTKGNLVSEATIRKKISIKSTDLGTKSKKQPPKRCSSNNSNKNRITLSHAQKQLASNNDYKLPWKPCSSEANPVEIK